MARHWFTCSRKQRNSLAVMLGFLVAAAAPLAAQAQQGQRPPALADRVSALEASVAALQEDLGALAGKVGALEAEDAALQEDLGALVDVVGALEASVEALQGDLGALADQVGALEADDGTLGALVDRVDALENEVETLADLFFTVQLGDPAETEGAGSDTAGAPFALRCPDDPDDTFAIGLLGRAGLRIDQLQVQCASIVGRSLSGPVLGDPVTTAAVGGFGGVALGSTLLCPEGTAMSGVFGQLTDDVVGAPVGALGVLCSPFGGGPPIRQGPVGAGSAQAEFTLPCPPGSVTTGIAGRFSEVLEQIQVECRDTTF
ncbi:MAG TPA: hypothetical protein VFZ01_16335 [Geminicoccaceae bacterium]